MTRDPKYKTFWLRFWAAIIDALVFVPLWVVDDWIWESHAPVWVNLAWYLTFTFSFLAYSIILHGRYGQTLGKRLCGVRVVDISESPLSMVQAVLRDLPMVGLTLWEVVEPGRRILAGLQPYDELQTSSEAYGDFFWSA
ncbi:MAG TPA: RDD family protein, partial [Polyangiaceae bacterium]|nr:RDD family protein [Polyangiaceae bacterium]